MAKTVFTITSRSTTQTPSPELQFTDVVVRDYSDMYGCEETQACADVLNYHKKDATLGDLAPIIVSCTVSQIIGLPDSFGVVFDDDCVTGGITNAASYFYAVTTQMSDYRTTRTGYVIATAKLRDAGAAAWNSGTSYAYGDQVLYATGGVNHNYLSLTGTSNLNRQPDLIANIGVYWRLNDISAAERAIEAAILRIADPLYWSGATYGLGDYVTSGGYQYRSSQAGNIGNDPATSPTFWDEVNPPKGAGILLLSNDSLTLG